MDQRKLKHRITVVRRGAKTPDEFGGYTYASLTPFDCFCSAKQLSQSESVYYGLNTNIAAYRFGFRYQSAKLITPSDTLIFKSRNFNIQKIENVDEANDQILIIASERV